MTLSSHHNPRPIVANEARLAEVVRSAPDAIVGETLGGTVTVWNRAAEELYGYPAVEMIGQSADCLCPAESRADEAAALRQVAAGHRPARCVVERIRRDGTTVRVWLRAAPIVGDTGAITGVATISCAADAGVPEAVSDVHAADRIGHELRTSLNAIIGFTGTLLLRVPGPLNPEQEHQLRLVQSSTEKLLSQINELSRPVSAQAGVRGSGSRP